MFISFYTNVIYAIYMFLAFQALHLILGEMRSTTEGNAVT